MNSITQVIRKVATAVRKTVLLGALVGGVSMIANATETTETNVGPTIEKAQLETVHINLEAVVAAITKVDPDWVKGLPMVNVTKPEALETFYWYYWDGTAVGALIDPNPMDVPTAEGITECAEGTNGECARGYRTPQNPGQPESESAAAHLDYN